MIDSVGVYAKQISDVFGGLGGGAIKEKVESILTKVWLTVQVASRINMVRPEKEYVSRKSLIEEEPKEGFDFINERKTSDPLNWC